MTTVKIVREGGRIRSVRAEGHTGYAEAGSDIVCAALSAVIQTAALGLARYSPGADIAPEGDGRFRIVLGERGAEADAILETMRLGVADLASQYPEYIRLIEENKGVTK